MRLKPYQVILFGGLLCGILDITSAFVMYGLRGKSPVRILQSVASGLLGADAYKGELTTAALGGTLHFFIAFSATAVYYAASRQLRFLLRQPVVYGMLYGMVVYAFMNLVVLPLSAFPNKISFSSTQLIIHMFCVGLPISLTISRCSSAARRTIQTSGAFYD